MSIGLPDVSGLRALPAESLHELASRLRATGLDAAYFDSLWNTATRRFDTVLSRPLALWHARMREDAAAVAVRIFTLRDPVDEERAAAILGSGLLTRLLDSGLLVGSAEGVVSRFDLRFFRGLLILCDDLSHGGEAVFGVGSGTMAFRAFSGQRNVRCALDLGCGAGAVALALARHAEHVVATDINPRALAFLRCNAVLNGIDNIDAREGDLFLPVQGKTFDMIASQPPYVPKAADLSPATYLFGGSRGNELVARLIDGLPEHLARDGRAIVVFEQARHPDEQEFGAAHILGKRMQTLLLYGDEVDADTFSVRHALPLLRDSVAAFDRAVTAMRRHLLSAGISSLYSAICVIEHAKSAAAGLHSIRASDDLWSNTSDEMIERLMAGRDLLANIAELGRANLKVPEGSLVIRQWPINGKDTTTYLGLPAGYAMPAIELNEVEWAEIERSVSDPDAAAPSRAVLEKAARAGLVQ